MLLSQLPLPDPDRLTPAEQHVLDKHPEWHTRVQLSMRVTNCATWHLGLHIAGRSGATTATAIRHDPASLSLPPPVVATMSILLPAHVTARLGASTPSTGPVSIPPDVCYVVACAVDGDSD